MLGEAFRQQSIRTGGARIALESGGEGPPLLLLHGYPQTHAMWHRLAPQLARHFTVVCPDLRGYGDSSKPPGSADHNNYSKREMARDMVEVMAALGFERFALAGHDRGARVAHRLALDHPQRVSRVCVMDIAPTLHMFEHTDQAFATGYYHWFFLIQPHGLPERMIGADPGWFLVEKLRRWAAPGAHFDEAAVAEYVRCFSQPEAIHASCEDYRAAAGIDLEHDRADFGRKRIACPLLVLWGERGFVNRSYDVLAVWQQYATTMSGGTVPGGHFLPEESPGAVLRHLLTFFRQA
ncbi:MAG: alpha/beta hydrolase [Rhodocyclaceae bacterium]|nr:alpha/beta hydrolase [Rhodocyclaceae bacterium]MCP5231244.1 alpha/beta hydrolase [Zoogloeaceae bacterium]MCP5293245.1 alpha/beta hydrolase [Zoogloeaceae bacterium]